MSYLLKIKSHLIVILCLFTLSSWAQERFSLEPAPENFEGLLADLLKAKSEIKKFYNPDLYQEPLKENIENKRLEVRRQFEEAMQRAYEGIEMLNLADPSHQDPTQRVSPIAQIDTIFNEILDYDQEHSLKFKTRIFWRKAFWLAPQKIFNPEELVLKRSNFARIFQTDNPGGRVISIYSSKGLVLEVQDKRLINSIVYDFQAPVVKALLEAGFRPTAANQLAVLVKLIQNRAQAVIAEMLIRRQADLYQVFNLIHWVSEHREDGFAESVLKAARITNAPVEMAYRNFPTFKGSCEIYLYPEAEFSRERK